MVTMPMVSDPSPEESAIRWILSLSDVCRQNGMYLTAQNCLKDALRLEGVRSSFHAAVYMQLAYIHLQILEEHEEVMPNHYKHAVENADKAYMACHCIETLQCRGKAHKAHAQYLLSINDNCQAQIAKEKSTSDLKKADFFTTELIPMHRIEDGALVGVPVE